MRRSTMILAALLMAPGANPALAQLSKSDSTVFLDAIRDGDGSKVTEILDAPGSRIVNTRERKTGRGAVHILAEQGNVQFLRYVLAKNANPDLQDTLGNTAALLAVQAGSVDAINALADYNADFNLANRAGDLPLTLAVRLRRLDIVRKLLEVGANPDRPDAALGLSARDYAKRDSRNPALLALIEELGTKKSDAPVAGPQL